MHASAIKSKSNKPSFTVINTPQHESLQSVKVIDLINGRMKTRDRFYSIEVSHFGNLSLNYNDFTVAPLFTSVTWSKDNLEMGNDSIEPAVQLINEIKSTPTLLHLTCHLLSELTLEKLLKMKFSNLLVLRGGNLYWYWQYDTYSKIRVFLDIVSPNQPLKHAIDLVKLIKQKSPCTSLSVGGYPDVHPEALSLQSDIKYLKDKVDAGADFIITQICFSSTKIIQFIAHCRDAGIKLRIIPGIFIPFSYNVLMSMCRLCKITVPEEEFKMYKLLKDDISAFQDFAVSITTKLLNDLFHNDVEPVLGVHFFTLNNFELMKRVTNDFDFK